MLDLERTRTVKGAEPSGVQIRRRRSDRRRHLSAFSVVGTSNLILIQPNECARSWTGSGTAGDTAQAATRQQASSSTTSTRTASRGNRVSQNSMVAMCRGRSHSQNSMGELIACARVYIHQIGSPVACVWKQV